MFQKKDLKIILVFIVVFWRVVLFFKYINIYGFIGNRDYYISVEYKKIKGYCIK